MKYLKMLGLAAVAAMALMAFFGPSSASAAVLCKTNAEPCGAGWDLASGNTLTGSLTSGTHATLKAVFSTVTCKKSHVAGAITNTGGSGASVEGHITALTFTECECNNERVADVEWTGGGTLSVNDAGTVTSKNTTATINCTGLAQCEYGTTAAGTDVGRFTDSAATGGTGELHAEATLTWFDDEEDSGQFVCAGFGDTGTWTASYQVTTPDPVYLKKS